MKNLLIATLIFLSFNIINSSIETEISQIKIKNILSKNVPLGGYLFLEAEGIPLILSSSYDINSFTLSSIYEKDKTYSSFACFFYRIKDYYIRENETVIIGCHIQKDNSINIGKYYFSPLENETSIELFDNSKIKLNIININEQFNIIEGEELLYFYNSKKIELNFKSNTESNTIKFDLFESVSYREIVIYLDDIKINCIASGSRITCPIFASGIPQEKRSKYFNVYIEDSKGNKFRNYFVPPIDILLNYVEKDTLEIKVSNLLTNYITHNDFIIFDTFDQTLENVIFSKHGFDLKLKKENSEIDVINLYCCFHKHQGDNTKIYCEIQNRNDDIKEGTYIFEEYISEGPLEDVGDRISRNYQIVIPSFKIDNKVLFKIENERNREQIYDIQLKEKIELNFKNKEDIEIIALDLDHYGGMNKYFLGNNQLECNGKLIKDLLLCEVPGTNFEKSGIYYFEKMNPLEEKERIYILPYVEALVSWD